MTDFDDSLRDLLFDLEPQSPIDLAAQVGRTTTSVIGEMRRRSLVFEDCAPVTGHHWWFRLTSDARAERYFELTGERWKRPRQVRVRETGTDRLSVALIVLERRHDQSGGGASVEWLAAQVGGMVAELTAAMIADRRFSRVMTGTTTYWWSAAALIESNAGGD